MSSFLGSLRAAGIAVPQGIAIVARSDRLSSEAAPSVASQAEGSSGDLIRLGDVGLCP